MNNDPGASGQSSAANGNHDDGASTGDHEGSRGRAVDDAGSALLPAIPTTFKRLEAPVPPMLEAAIGYEGDARYVAFYWGGGDEAYCDDGRISFTADWQPYLLFLRHRAIWPGLIGHDFGTSDAPAREYLLLDRRQRMLYAAPARATRNFLIRQWTQPTTAELTNFGQFSADEVAKRSAELAAQFQDLLQRHLEDEVRCPPAEREVLMTAMIADQRLRHHALAGWLDALPDDGRAQALVDEFGWQLDEAIREGKPFDGTLPF